MIWFPLFPITFLFLFELRVTSFSSANQIETFLAGKYGSMSRTRARS
jgi:hypothetical protein